METVKVTKKEAAKQKRAKLVALSKGVQMLVREGMFGTVNEGLKHFYEEEHGRKLKLNSFRGWLKEGRAVKKGEKAFLFWGSPRKVPVIEAEEQSDKEYKYFPIAYLFDIEQTEKKEEKG